MTEILNRHYPTAVTEAIIARHFRLTPDDGELYEHARRCVYNAFDTAEDYTNRIIVDSVARFTLDAPEGSVFELPSAPVKEVLSIRYRGADNEWHDIPSTDYRLLANAQRARLRLLAVPDWAQDRTMAVEIEARCGFADYNPDDERDCEEGIALVGGIEQAVMLLAGTFFEYQSDTVAGSTSKIAAESLLNPWRIMPYGGEG